MFTQIDALADAEMLYAARVQFGHVYTMPSAWQTFDGPDYCTVLPIVRTAHSVQYLDCLVYDKTQGRIIQEGDTPWE